MRIIIKLIHPHKIEINMKLFMQRKTIARVFMAHKVPVINALKYHHKATAIWNMPSKCFSNFRPLSDEEEFAKPSQPRQYKKYDPEAAEPEIDEEEFKRMQASLAKFA